MGFWLETSPTLSRLLVGFSSALCKETPGAPDCGTLAAAAAQWKSALEVFEMMRCRGCKPDIHAYGSLLGALAGGGQWQECLRVYQRMQARP